MTIKVTDLDHYVADEPRGTGCLVTERGNLPLHKVDVRAAVTGLVARTEVVQGFRNPFDVALEATYVFPLPDRAALTAMTMTADGRTVVAELHERAQARQAYDDALAAGRRAAIAEEDRPDVFTMRVGNIGPGEEVEIALTVVGPLPFEDGAATFRFPLVVAPRYIPGRPRGGEQSGAGYAPDTDATPDAGRITPPVLLPGFPNPIDLSIEVHIDAAGLPLGPVTSSLHTITTDDAVIRVQPGERVNRDFILRLPYGEGAIPTAALSVVADPEGDEGTFQFTVVPPLATQSGGAKDVVLLLDRSGSMGGWKMVAARRAAARIVDTLSAADRFAVLTFDDRIDRPDGLPAGLVAGSDRHRYRAVEHLGRADARGGTELLQPLLDGLRLLGGSEPGRDRVLVLITDGQVGNEDQILDATARLLSGVRVHTVGIDQAVNAGFLGRLAVAGGGRCELVESEDRLDEAMDAIHRRIAAPLVTGLRLSGAGIIGGTVSPARLPDVFPGVPTVIRGRYQGDAPALTLSGATRDDAPWHETANPTATTDAAMTQVWARATVRDLEDAYASQPNDVLEARIVATSLRFGVLCRFTAFVAAESRVSNETGELHRVIQPVELPAGWDHEMAVMPAFAPMFAAPGAMAAGYAVPASASGSVPLSFGSGGGRRFKGARRASAGAMRESEGGRTDAELAAARTAAADEVRRLEQRPASDTDLRDALDDLASRLTALARHLRSVGASEARLDRVIAVLQDAALPLDERWTNALRLLREFAAGKPARQFWKRT